MWESGIFKVIAGSGTLGVVLVLGYLLIKGYEAWDKRRTAADKTLTDDKLADKEVEAGTSQEWRRLAQFQQRRIHALETRMTAEEESSSKTKRKHEEDMNKLWRAEQQCLRQYNAIRIRCDRYEEAMRQANIPFRPFDSDEFSDKEEVEESNHDD